MGISKKEILKVSAIILAIFFIGFFLRIESTNMVSVPDNEKAFYQDQNGIPYMYELDSYYNYRLTKNYIDHGYPGDTVINGREWDLHSYYPPGVPMDYPPLIVYIAAFLYKFINLFASVPLISVCFWIPAFIGPLSGIVAYFFVRRYTNDYGAVAAGIFAVTTPILTARTVPGWFDTDMFNVLFPLLVTWLFIEALDNRNNFKRGILISAVATFSMFLFSIAWNGWQYTFYIIILFSFFYIIWCKLKGRNVKNFAYVLGTFFVGTLLMVGLFTGFLNIIKLFAGPFELIKISGTQNPWTPWPDVYTSVSELGKPSLEEVISGVGLSFFGGIFGLLWILRILINKELKKRFLNKMTWFFFMFLVVWTVIGFFAVLKGARFIIMLVPPLVISAGIMIGISAGYLSILKDNKRFDIFQRRKSITGIISILILVWITVPSLLSGYNSYSSLIPSADDDLHDASQWINNNTPKDTVIISIWDYGHLFTAIADRPVSFDGRMGYIETLPVRNYDTYSFKEKSPGTSREYWINKAFATGNESLSAGIFRMLSTSGDSGYLTLDNYTKNTTKSVEILNNILGVDRNAASQILIKNYGLNEKQAENVLKYTHPTKPAPFVILTTDGMVDRGQWIFRFGEWNFKELKEGNYTYSAGKINTSNNVLNTTNGIYMDLKNGKITWNEKIPYCMIKISGGKTEKIYLDKNSDFCVILIMDDEKSLVIDRKFENSLFTKLIVERSNTQFFKALYKNKSVMAWKSIYN
jgi:dolichyl-diphosphooligosaccharide--protein glycosyltransferase